MKDIFWSSEPDEEESTSTKSDENSSTDNDESVDSYNHNIYFYSEVSRSKILTLNKKIAQVGVKLVNFTTSLEIPLVNIKLHINSYGGSVFAGMAAVDHIRNSIVPVDTVVNGCAASAATIMSVVGKTRYMQENSFMLIHQISSGMWGKFEELKDDIKNNELLMKKIVAIYEEHTRLPKKQLAKILKHDLWWDAKTCLKYGLVDDIITP